MVFQSLRVIRTASDDSCGGGLGAGLVVPTVLEKNPCFYVLHLFPLGYDAVV